MSTFDPFGADECTVLDEPHVRVDRVVVSGKGSKSIRYAKTFKFTPAFDYTWFASHEAALLQHLKAEHVHRVVQIAEAAWGDDGSVSRVVTVDAGPSLHHWIEAAAGPPPYPSISRVFSDPRSLLWLARSVLLALHQVHSAGVVHADVDARNICLPYKPHPRVAGEWTPDWPQLKLIDFAFSVCPEDPLRVPLPVKPDPGLHSPAFMKALDSDLWANTTRHVQRLDGRIDLHAFGLLLGRMLRELSSQWSSEKTAQVYRSTLMDLAQALRAIDASTARPFDLQTHHRLLAPVDRLLDQQSPDEWSPHFRLDGLSIGGPTSTVGSVQGDTAKRESPPVNRIIPAATPLAPPRAAATPLQVLPPVGAGPQADPPSPVSAVVGPAPLTAALQLGTTGFISTRARAPAGRNRIALPHAPSQGMLARVWSKLMDSLRLERYRRAAARGDPRASYEVGAVLLRGKAVPGSAVEALKWFLAAAHQGYVPAQVAAASCLEHGHGAEPDDAEAARWYAMAASGGSARGHYGLASLMLQGRVSPGSPATAIAHLREAAQSELPEAYDALGQVLLSGRGAAMDIDDALECFQRAATLGFAASAHRLGHLHEHPPQGRLADPRKAMWWYAKALRLGHHASSTDLERLRLRFPS